MKIIRRLLCFIGWHRWVWKFEEGTELSLTANGNNAACKYCGISYRKGK